MMQVSPWCRQPGCVWASLAQDPEVLLAQVSPVPTQPRPGHPQTPPGSDRGTGRRLPPVFTLCWKMLLFEKVC